MNVHGLVVSLLCVSCVSSVLSDEISKWDPRMAVEKASVDTNGVKWIDGRYLPLEGRAFDDTEHYYDRLPSNVTANVNGGVRSMKHHTAGMQYRFRTDSPTLTFEWVPYSDSLSMDHMPSTGVSGIDVYRFDTTAGKWRYVRTGRVTDRRRTTLRIGWKPGDACLVNLPLYNGVRSFRLGLATNATVSALGPRASGVDKPVVFYGTSITHGGCSSRPGLSWVNIVGRDLDVPVVNLGFSGSGRMEYEMSEHLARIDASCYVLDCLWNMNCCRGAAGTQDEKDVAAAGCGSAFTDANTRIYFQVRYEPFIRNLRRLRPGVPIVMAEQCDVYAKGPNFKDRFIRALYEKLVAEGWTNLVYLPKTDMYNGDCEGTVDGCHPNDWGMMSMARAFGGAVKEALDRAAHPSPPPPPGPEGWAFRRELAEEPPPDFAPPTGTPWLENRISRCFFSPIKRPPFNRDELKDDIDYYPDNYLERLRREGVNGLWLSLALDDLDEASLAKLRKTVAKCGVHGIKVWAFGIEPKGRPYDHPFFKAHPEARGARSWDGKHVNCPSAPALLAELEAKVARLFTAVPDLAGMINIANGERATTCLSFAKTTDETPAIPCAACAKRAPWELYADVAAAVVKGMRRGNPRSRLITWFYHPESAATRGGWVYECVRHVPDGAEIQYNFESGAEREQLGQVRHGGDYWLSFPGPAEPFRRMADAARSVGAPIAAKIQTSCSHECATVPYVPVPGLLYRKFKGMREAGVRDVMMCWYFGNAPGLMNRAAGRLAYEDFTTGEEAFLERLARDEWGEDAAVMGNLWKRFSDAYARYPLSILIQYYGPFHAGFSWPLYPNVSMRSLQRTWKPLETPGGDLMGEALADFTLDEAYGCAESMTAELKGVRPVLERLRAKYAADKPRRRDLGVMLTLMNLFESGRNIFRFYALRRDAVFASRIDGDHVRARTCADEMAAILRRESEISREMIPLCDDDSRLGFHSEAQAHQFTSAYLAWRIGELDRAAAELAAIRTALAAGRPWPESARERTAATQAATEQPDGSLVVSGTCPDLAEGLGMELRTYDLCGTAPARVYEVRPTNGTYRVVLPAADWKDDPRLKPAWVVVRQGGDYNNGGTTWASPNVPMFREPRLCQAALTGDNFARLVVKSRGKASAAETVRRTVSAALADEALVTDVEALSKGAFRVAFTLCPTSVSFIRCEMRLPAPSDWDGRLWGRGNGGWAGRTSCVEMGASATVHTDLGTSRIPIGTNPVDPEILKDFGWRATHLMTVAAKKVIRAHYGRDAHHAYFYGESTGGGQGMCEVQRYPEDYDGVIAGVPALDRSTRATTVWQREDLRRRFGGKWFTGAEKAAIRKAELAVFAKTDPSEARGRFIWNPHPTPAKLDACWQAIVAECPALADRRDLWYALFDPVVVNGRRLAPGQLLGVEFAFPWTFMLEKRTGPREEGVKMTAEELIAFSEDPDLAFKATDLSAFRKRGGKLILYSGLEDEAVPPRPLAEYYTAVVARDGSAAETGRYFAFYELPGRWHNNQGKPDGSLGAVGHPKDIEAKIVAWVERDERPGSLEVPFSREPERKISVAPFAGFQEGEVGAPTSGSSRIEFGH